MIESAFGSIKKIHFIGIGGVGMGGIAEVLLNLGYEISGSDAAQNAMTKHLQKMGAQVVLGHHANHVENTNLVVVSSAIQEANPEIVAARAARIPIVARAEMLAELMRFRYGIAVSGTHGKTTTTSLVTSLLKEGGLDPTFVIGGRLNSAGTNAKLGEGKYLVAEADESDASFLYLKPMLTVVTNIDADHLATYKGDFDLLKNTFLEFLHHLPFYGRAVLCVDDPVIRELIPKIARPMVTYGLHEDADVRAIDFRQEGTTSLFTIVFDEGRKQIPIRLALPGTHNVQNALAAFAVALEVGVSHAAIQEAFSKFQGIGRRFQIYGDIQYTRGKGLLVDDYGHHPKELAMTIEAVRRAWPKRTLAMLFQPHRYSRTQDLFEEFVEVLGRVDQLFLMNVYSANEQHIEGADSVALAKAIEVRHAVQPILIPEPKELQNILNDVMQDDAVLLTQGAGNVGAVAAQLAEEMSLGHE